MGDRTETDTFKFSDIPPEFKELGNKFIDAVRETDALGEAGTTTLEVLDKMNKIDDVIVGTIKFYEMATSPSSRLDHVYPGTDMTVKERQQILYPRFDRSLPTTMPENWI